MPAVRTLAVSGSRFGFERDCWRVSVEPNDAPAGTPWFAHSSATPGSSVIIAPPSGRVSHGSEPGSVLAAVPWYISLIAGARNAVENVPRSAKALTGR